MGKGHSSEDRRSEARPRAAPPAPPAARSAPPLRRGAWRRGARREREQEGGSRAVQPVSGQGQGPQASQHHPAPPSKIVRRHAEPHRRQSLGERADGDLGLQPRERRTETEVDPETEREVAVGLPRQVDRLGIRELALVPVRGGEHRVRERPARDRGAADRHVLTGIALGGRLEGAVVAEQLLDAAGRRAPAGGAAGPSGRDGGAA